MAGTQPDSAATTGYEAELWAMADTLRWSMDGAEYISGELRDQKTSNLAEVVA